MTLAGIGPIIYPPLINYLLHIYDVSGCMLIIGAISLHMLVAAVLLQPLKWHLVRDKSYYIPQLDSVYQSTTLPNVATYLSIGKFSDSSCKFLFCLQHTIPYHTIPYHTTAPRFIWILITAFCLNFSCTKQLFASAIRFEWIWSRAEITDFRGEPWHRYTKYIRVWPNDPSPTVVQSFGSGNNRKEFLEKNTLLNTTQCGTWYVR